MEAESPRGKTRFAAGGREKGKMAETRLLLCNHQAPAGFIGGAESILLEIARGLSRDTFDILLLANAQGDFNQAASDSGLTLRIIPHDMLWDFLAPGHDIADRFQRFEAAQKKQVEAINKTIRENKIKALIVNCLVNTVPLMAASECGIPAIWMIHEIVHAFDSLPGGLRKALRFPAGNRSHRHDAQHFIQKTILQYCHMSVFITETSRKKIFDSREWRDRAVVLQPPVRRDVYFAPYPVVGSYPGIPDSAFSVVFLGILVPHKGVHDFIHAASEVAKAEANVHFTIAGGSPAPNYVRKLKKMAEKKNLGNRIQFTGFLRNPLPLIDRADVICMPSLYEEPFGMVVSEGMTRGKVVLAYDTGSIREVIEEGKTGYILPRGNTKAMAEKITELMNNREAMATVGKNAAAAAGERFDPDLYIARLEDIVERVIAR
jgi:glycosyltransferase involved in cell wall biosynthesis